MSENCSAATEEFRQFCDTLKICLKIVVQQLNKFRQFCNTLKIHLKACLKISDVQPGISDIFEKHWDFSGALKLCLILSNVFNTCM